MMDVDLEALEALRSSLQSDLDRDDRTRRTRPLQDETFKHISDRHRELDSELLAPARAKSVLSILRLEKSLDESEDNARARAEELATILACVRARTDGLRQWLEDLS